MEDWFTVEPLAPDTWAISEYRHWEETHCYLLAGSYPAPEIYTLQHYLYNRFHSGDYASAAAALYLILPVSAGMVLALLKGEKYAEA